MMILSNDLIAQFVKSTKDTTQPRSETTVYGTVVEYDNSLYVMFDGSELLTPVNTTTALKAGERVTVMIKNHTATVTGNISSPSVSDSDISDLGDKMEDTNQRIDEFDKVAADFVKTEQLVAEQARIDTLIADNVTIRETLTANEGYIKELQTDNVTVNEKLTANEADIQNLKTTSLTAETADIKYATIENLEATRVIVYELNASYGNFTTLTTDKIDAIEATILELEAGGITTDQLEAKFANIDFANIGEAAIVNLFSKSGLIEDLIVSDGTITGNLVGVTIKGDVIEGNTIVADKLVVKGDDGLYYKLNTDGVTVETEQTDYNSLNGSVITAKSITATKISVDDLVAFDATIGGFHITDTSIYSGVKTSVENTTQGIYLDSGGQVALGDSINYIRYYETENGSYTLEIATGGKTIEKQIDEIEFNGRNLAIGTTDEWTEYTHSDNATAFEFTVGNVTDDRHTISEFAVKNGEYLSIGIDLKAINRPLRLRVDYARTTDGDPSSTLISYKDYYGEYVQVNEEGRSALTIPIDAHSAYIYVAIASDNSVSEPTIEQYKCFQIEKSSKPTDWKPAPEDVKTSIEESEARTNTTISEHYSSLVNSYDGLKYTIGETYVGKDDLNEYATIEDLETKIEAKAGEIEIGFNGTIESVEGTFNSFYETFSKYIKFTSDTAITIGSGDSAITLEIDNETGIIFKKNGEQFGWWDGTDFHTGNIVVNVNERAQFGNFAFTPRSDGSLMFLKVGG